MNIKVLLIYQVFKGKFAKGEVATQSLYMKQLVTVKCHISIYILEKGVVKFKPLERQEVFDTML